MKYLLEGLETTGTLFRCVCSGSTNSWGIIFFYNLRCSLANDKVSGCREKSMPNRLPLPTPQLLLEIARLARDEGLMRLVETILQQ